MNTEFDLRFPAADRAQWLLDPAVVFLNHGSFGACPKPVLAAQDEWRVRLERQPLQFLGREQEGCLDLARAELARFVGSDADDLVFVPNATTGVNSVLRSLKFSAGDELLVTSQEYNACRNVIDFVAADSGARVVVVPMPFPVRDEAEFTAAILAQVTSRTRLLLIDHVTSQTGLVLPIGPVVAELNRRGIDTLVDGAHAPGMIPLALSELNAAYYTGNCHKWLCSPKGAAFLRVRRDRQPGIRPLVISHGANSPRRDRSRFLLEFGWTGTFDPSAALCVPAAIQFMDAVLPGGWPELMARNRALTLAARKWLCASLGIPEPCPAAFVGSLAVIPLPDAPAGAYPRLPWNEYPLQDTLRLKHGIEVPVVPWPAAPKRLLRIAAQAYNSLPQYEFLAQVLGEELKAEQIS